MPMLALALIAVGMMALLVGAAGGGRGRPA